MAFINGCSMGEAAWNVLGAIACFWCVFLSSIHLPISRALVDEFERGFLRLVDYYSSFLMRGAAC